MWRTLCGAILAGSAICGWLVTVRGNRPPDDEPIRSTAESREARVFHVLQYGAVADGATDNSAAFSACLQAVIEAGGGRMYLPAGVYKGRIRIPMVSAGKWISLEIVGESQPASIFGTVGRFELGHTNTVVQCSETSGPAVISAAPGNPQTGGFSGVHVVLRDLEVRTYPDPHIGGIDLEWAQQCRVENVIVNTGVYNVQAPQPTHQTAGLVTPAINNGALTILRNVIVTGFHTGMVVNEHTDGEQIVVASNVHGLSFAQAYHASRFGRVGAYRCTNSLTVTGTHGFSIAQLNIEHAGPNQTDDKNAWQTTVYDVNDPDNRGVADINYWVVEGNVGISHRFTRNGGASIRAGRIGSEPDDATRSAPQGSSRRERGSPARALVRDSL